MFVEIKSQRIPLDIGQLYLLGKQINDTENNANNFIKLDEGEDIEQKHCIIEVGHGEEVFVFDLFSSKGTLVNNIPLKALEKLRLKNGDILKVGKQEVKYIHDRQEVSHDSSGFLEVNKNTSDIIPSSPESTSQHESRIKRANYNNFLVPQIPHKQSVTPNTSLVIPETNSNASRNSLNSSSNSLNSNNRRSDSFTIPETQYCRPRSSLNASDLSIAESNPDVSRNKIQFKFGNIDDENDDDDFCIPETQEVLPVSGITSSQRPRTLADGQSKEKSILLEESKNYAEDTNNIDGSQFRICTQDYNEGFGEENKEPVYSQIIPLIKHHPIILNYASKSCNETSKNQSKIEEDEKEMSTLKWSNSKVDQETTALRADSSTPDILEFDELQPQSTGANACGDTNKAAIAPSANLQDEDDEDLLPTQVFLPSANIKSKKSSIEPEKDCMEKENEEVLTLSDKENTCPATLEQISDLPPTQLFATNEVFTARSTTSSFSRNSLTTPVVENKNNFKSLLNLDPEDEDDLLTEDFLQPINLPSTSSRTNMPVKCFNSTALEDKFMAKNQAPFLVEMEKTSLQQNVTPALNFKMPDQVIRKTSSTTSSTSETDLDLLMCTPQLIKEHIHMDKGEDLRRNILAVKNKHLFGNDTDDEENEEDADQDDLVKLINIPKDSLDFDKLLPHLKRKPQKSKISEEAKAAKEAQKLFKFNVSFGQEQDEKQTKSPHSRSTTLSRDIRHMARDKERELVERKERTKSKGNTKKGNKNVKKAKQIETTTAQQVEEQNSSSKKVQNKEDEQGKVKEDEQNKPEKITRQRRQAFSDKNAEAKKEDQIKEMPARRMTRATSRYEETASTSKKAASNNNSTSTQDEEDDLDSIATQPFEANLKRIATRKFVVRMTRCRSSSKRSESQNSITSNKALSKNASQHNKSKNDSSLSHNASVNGNVSTKTTGEQRKRKAQATPPVVPEKIERKRLRSTHSQESPTKSNNSSTATPIITISMTMVDQELFKYLFQNSKGYWSIAKNPADSEVLIMDKAFRTFKFLFAMARGIPIVTSEYLKKLNASSKPQRVCINDYLFTDANFEKKHKFSFVKSLQMAKKHILFKGYEFVMTASILPNPQEIKAIIEVSGGYVHDKTPPEPKKNQQLYLVTAQEDKREWYKYRRLNKNIIIVSTEAIMSAVMRQTCKCMTSYTLS